MKTEIKEEKESRNLGLPIGLAILGLVAIGITTFLLIQKAEKEENDLEADFENYDSKKVPIL